MTPNRKITQRLRSASDRHLWSAREAKWCCGSGDAHQRWPQDCPDRSGMQRPGPPRRSLPKTRHLPRGRIPGSWGKSREVRTLPGAPLSHSNKYISQRETEEENEAGASDQQVPTPHMATPLGRSQPSASGLQGVSSGKSFLPSPAKPAAPGAKGGQSGCSAIEGCSGR